MNVGSVPFPLLVSISMVNNSSVVPGSFLLPLAWNGSFLLNISACLSPWGTCFLCDIMLVSIAAASTSVVCSDAV